MVLRRMFQKFTELKKVRKCLKNGSAQGLPVNPLFATKSLKAICTPYMGTYEKIKKYKKAGRINKYNTLLRRMSIQLRFLPVAVYLPGRRCFLAAGAAAAFVLVKVRFLLLGQVHTALPHLYRDGAPG